MKTKIRLLFISALMVGIVGCGKYESNIGDAEYESIDSTIDTDIEEVVTEVEESTDEVSQEVIVEEMENVVIDKGVEDVIIEPFGEYDFIVSGDNSVIAQTEDGSVISKFEINGWEYAYQTFIEGDSFATYRDISFPATKEEIIKLYGNVASRRVDLSNDNIYSYGKSEGSTDILIIENANEFIEFTYNEYGMRFYFDEQDNLLLVAYYKNYNMLQSNTNDYKSHVVNEATPESNLGLINPNTGAPLQPGDHGVTNGFEWEYVGDDTGLF